MMSTRNSLKCNAIDRLKVKGQRKMQTSICFKGLVLLVSHKVDFRAKKITRNITQW